MKRFTIPIFIILILGISLFPNLVSAQPNEMPEWVSQVIQHWSNGNINDVEFFYAMNFLANNNIITKDSFKNQLVKIQKTSVEDTLVHSNYRVFVDSFPKDSNLDYSIIDDAVLFWKKNNVNFILVDDQHMANAKIFWIKEMDGPNDGYVIKGDRIEIGLGTSIDGKWHGYDKKSISFLVKHELGHFLGCPHSTDPQNIMYPKYNEYTKYDHLPVC